MGTYSQLLKKPQSGTEQKTIVAKEPPKSDPAKESHVASNTATVQQSNIATQQYDNTASNIAIMQFDENDINSLKQGTYQPQTFRLREEEIEWLRDQAYQLSKAMKRGKVNQVDILRIGLRICYKLIETDKQEIIEILAKMK